MPPTTLDQVEAAIDNYDHVFATGGYPESPSIEPMRSMVRILRASKGDALSVTKRADFDTAFLRVKQIVSAETITNPSVTGRSVSDFAYAAKSYDDGTLDPEAALDAAWRFTNAPTAARFGKTRQADPSGNAPEGRARVLTRGQKMADFAGTGYPMGPDDGSSLGLHRYLKAVVTGDWTGLPSGAKAQAVGVGALGGFIVPTQLSTQIIDLARNASVAIRAGALTVPMDTSELTMARLAGDGSGSWKQENAAAAVSDLSFERVTFKARTLVAIVKSSVELFEDASTLEATVEGSLGAALALELDRAALRGSGAAGEPLGILNQPGVTITGSIGSPADYVSTSDTPTRTLREANAAEPYAFVSAPRTFESLEKLKTGIAGDLTRLAPPPAWNAYQRFSSNQVPINLGGGTNESEAYVGDFAQLMIGVRTQLAIEVSRQASDSSSSAFTNLQVWIRAYLRADIQLAHPDHFNVLTGILA